MKVLIKNSSKLQIKIIYRCLLKLENLFNNIKIIFFS